MKFQKLINKSRRFLLTIKIDWNKDWSKFKLEGDWVNLPIYYCSITILFKIMFRLTFKSEIVQ